MSKNVLITGTSGGFGKMTVLSLLQQGDTVIASMRGVEGKNQAIAKELSDAGAHVVEIDVTDSASVETGVAAAFEAAGDLDVLINNAGTGVIGLQESFTPDDWQTLFNINVFGVQRMNRAVLPQMRARGSGLLIHVSSLLGRIAMPFYGPYNASKWALEAMAENYRIELSGFGVDSVVVEPGGYPTSFMENLLRPSDAARDASYGDLAHAPMAMATSFEETLASNPEQNPQDVADAIVNLINTPAGQRPFRTVVDKMGMGDPIVGYNEQLAQIHQALYAAFGMEGMLELKV